MANWGRLVWRKVYGKALNDPFRARNVLKGTRMISAMMHEVLMSRAEMTEGSGADRDL
jgi:hypothetical protein